MPASQIRFPNPLHLLLLVSFLAFAATSPALAQQSSVAEAAEDITKPLLDVLKDDAARAKLIESLEKSTTPAAPATPEAKPKQHKTVVGELSLIAKNTIERTIKAGRRFLDDISGLASIISTYPGESVAFTAMLGPLLLTIAASLIINYGARWLFRAAAGHMARRFGKSGASNAFLDVGIFFLAEVAALSLALFGTGALATTVFSPTGMTVFEAFYLNAFLIFGAVSIFIKLMTGIIHGEYSLLKIPSGVRKLARRRGTLLAGFLIFGIAFVVPTLNNLVSISAGRGIRTIIYTLAAIFAVWMIAAIAAAQKGETEGETVRSKEHDDEVPVKSSPGPVHALLLRIWPLFAYIYVATSYLIALTHPDIFVRFVGGATLRTVLALVVGALIMRLSNHLATRTVRAPGFLPLDHEALSGRFASTAPFILKALWFIIATVVIAVILDAWNIIDLRTWLITDNGSILVDGFVSSMIVVLVSITIWAVTTSWIDHRIQHGKGSAHTRARRQTLYSLLKSALTVAVVIFGGMIALSELGVDIGPLIAGAGVLGLAIGFGSQKLVQDIISGIFIQLENAMNVGDSVTAGGISGTVERLTLRSVALRDLAGVYHIVPFNSVDVVSNSMRLFGYHVAELRLDYKQNVADGKAVLQEAFDRLMQTDHKANILEPLEMHGVTALTENAVLVRARIKTTPGGQFALGRAYTELVKAVMDERNIEIPYPHTTFVLDRDTQDGPDEIAIGIKPADGGQTGPDKTK